MTLVRLKAFIGKLFIAALAFLTALLFTACIQVQNPEPQLSEGREYQGFRYVVDYQFRQVQITGYAGTATDVIIPAQIEKLPVTRLIGRKIVIN